MADNPFASVVGAANKQSSAKQMMFSYLMGQQKTGQQREYAKQERADVRAENRAAAIEPYTRFWNRTPIAQGLWASGEAMFNEGFSSTGADNDLEGLEVLLDPNSGIIGHAVLGMETAVAEGVTDRDQIVSAGLHAVLEGREMTDEEKSATLLSMAQNSVPGRNGGINQAVLGSIGAELLGKLSAKPSHVREHGIDEILAQRVYSRAFSDDDFMSQLLSASTATTPITTPTGQAQATAATTAVQGAIPGGNQAARQRAMSTRAGRAALRQALGLD